MSEGDCRSNLRPAGVPSCTSPPGLADGSSYLPTVNTTDALLFGFSWRPSLVVTVNAFE